jgi:hypothetical protein
MPKILLLLILLASNVHTHADTLKLVGESQLNMLFLPIYHSRLFTENGQYHPGQTPIKLEIQYLMNIKARHLLERTAKEWENLGVDAQQRQQWLSELRQLWPDIKKHDTLALYIDQHNTSTFYWNNQPLGQINDTRLGQHFLDIWLSPDTSQPEHRLDLLGLEPTKE